MFLEFRKNGKRKWQTSICWLQRETENRSLFSLVGKRSCLMSMSPGFHFSISISPCPCLHVSGIPQTENGTKPKTGTSVCFLQTANGHGKLQFVGCKWKLKTEVCFPWSANGKW
jgi:hypothetical protein